MKKNCNNCRQNVFVVARKTARGFAVESLVFLIKIYKITVSPLLGPCCRFHPSCSIYCMQAVKLHGLARGCRLFFKRIIKCHPFHPGGLDPVPLELKK